MTYEDILDALMPHWAEREATGAYNELRARLCTRDSRKVGNAVVRLVLQPDYTDAECIEVQTDAGNVLRLTASELEELFYPPIWIMKDIL